MSNSRKPRKSLEHCENLERRESRGSIVHDFPCSRARGARSLSIRAVSACVLAVALLVLAPGGCNFSSNSDPNDPEAQKHAIETYAKSYGTDYDDHINAVVPMDDGGLLLLGARQTDPTAPTHHAAAAWACRTDALGDSPRCLQVGESMADGSDNWITDIYSLFPQPDGSTIAFGRVFNEYNEPSLWRARLDSLGQIRQYNTYDDIWVEAVVAAFPQSNGSHAVVLYDSSDYPYPLSLSLCVFDSNGTKTYCVPIGLVKEPAIFDRSFVITYQRDGSYVLGFLDGDLEGTLLHYVRVEADGTVSALYSEPLPFVSLPYIFDMTLYDAFLDQFKGPYFTYAGAIVMDDGRIAWFGTFLHSVDEFSPMVIAARPESPDHLSADIHEYCVPVTPEDPDFCVPLLRCVAATASNNGMVIGGVTRNDDRLGTGCELGDWQAMQSGWVAALDERLELTWYTDIPSDIIGAVTSVEPGTAGESIAHGRGWRCEDGSNQTFTARIAADGTYLDGQSVPARQLPGTWMASAPDGSVALYTTGTYYYYHYFIDFINMIILDANGTQHHVHVSRDDLVAYADIYYPYVPVEAETLSIADKTPVVLAVSDGWLVNTDYDRDVAALLKLDPIGNVLWTLPGGPAYAEDELYAGTRDGEGAVAAGRSLRRKQTSATLSRWNKSGDLISSVAYGRVGTNVAYAVQPLSTGGYLLAGSTNAFGQGGTDALVFVVSADGSVKWARAIGGQGTGVANAVAERLDLGGYLVAGTSDSRAPWLVLLSPAGEIIWQYELNIENAPIPRAVQRGLALEAGPDNSIYFAAGDYGLIKSSVTDYWALAFEQPGEPRRFLTGVKQQEDGSLLVSGTYRATDCADENECAEFWVARMSADGAPIWERTFGAAKGERAASLALTADGGAAIVGSTNSITATQDGWVTKIDGDGQIVEGCQAASSEGSGENWHFPQLLVGDPQFATTEGQLDVIPMTNRGEPIPAPTVSRECAGETVTEYALDISYAGNGTITSAPGEVNCPATCREFFAPNTAVTLTATPAEGFIFEDWSAPYDGQPNPLTLTMSRYRSVRATFVDHWPLTIQVAEATGGRILVDPGSTECVDHCQYPILLNAAVTLRAIADPGFELAEWSGDVSGADFQQTVTMDGPKTVVARFQSARNKPFVLHVVGNGSAAADIPNLLCRTVCNGIVAPGDRVTCVARADDGWAFAGWSGAATSSNTTIVVMITQARTDLTATFVPRDNPNRPPVARFTLTSPAPPGVPLEFDASDSFDDVGIASYSWDFNNDGVIDLQSGAPIATYAYMRSGIFDVRLAVSDGELISEEVHPIVINNINPVASFIYDPPAPGAGETVHFDASASHDDYGQVVEYNWTWDDGTAPMTTNSPHADHVFSTTGDYNVQLMVRDDLGALSDPVSATVHVGGCGDPAIQVGAFPLSDWGHEYVGQGTATEDVSESFSGGNPDDYRNMSVHIVAGEYLVTDHIYLNKTYDPDVSGPVTSIDYSEDVMHNFSSNGYTYVTPSFFVEQNGVRYLYTMSSYGAYNGGGDPGVWYTRTAVGLTALDFTDSLTHTHPDFSTGSMRFGYRRSIGTYDQNHSIQEHGIDNFEVTIRRCE